MATILVFFAVWTPIIALVRGAFILWFWNWFILPVFETAPVINFWEGLGLSLVVTLFTYQISADNDSDDVDEVVVTAVTKSVVFYIFAAIFAIIIKAFM